MPSPDSPDQQAHRFNEIGRGLLQFALDLWRHLELQSGRRSGNVLFSPYVVASTLEALLHAAKGGTGHQIAHALNLPSRHVHLDDYFARLHAQCRSCLGVSSLRFQLRNLLHHDRSVRVRREFRRRGGGVHSLAHDLSGDAEGSLASIVDQVRQAAPHFATHQILPPESLVDASLILLSFVVFAGGWRVRFSRARTTDAAFHLAPGRTKKVRMMHQSGRYLVADSPGLNASALVLPYRRCGAVMVLFLPNDPAEGLAALRERLTTDVFEQLRFQERELDVSLPRFRLRQVTDLKRVLPAMGVQDVFTERADLSSLSPARGTHVSAWRHVACFSATERGGKPDGPSSELSGTALQDHSGSQRELSTDDASTSPRAERRNFVVDRPFMFLVLNDDVDFFLLFGLVRK